MSTASDFEDLQAGTEIASFTWNFVLPGSVTLIGTPCVTVTSPTDANAKDRLGPVVIGTATNPDGSPGKS